MPKPFRTTNYVLLLDHEGNPPPWGEQQAYMVCLDCGDEEYDLVPCARCERLFCSGCLDPDRALCKECIDDPEEDDDD